MSQNDYVKDQETFMQGFNAVEFQNEALPLHLQIGLLDRIDAMYRRTDFGHGFKGMGFQIKEVGKLKES